MGRGGNVGACTAGTIITGVTTIDEALAALTELVGRVAMGLIVSVLSAICADTEYWAILGFVRFGLAPGAVRVGRVKNGIDVLEVLAKVSVGDEKGYVFVKLCPIFDALIGVTLR